MSVRRRPRGQLGLAWAALSFCKMGCSETSLEWVPLPEGPAGSYVVAVTEGQDLLEIVALPPDEPARARAFPRNAEVHLLAYQPTLEALGLVPGEIGLASSCERPCRLVAPDASWAHPIGEGQWVPASVPSAVADRLVPDRAVRCGCLPIQFETLSYGSGPGAVMAISRPDGALLFNLNGSLSHLGLDHQIAPICTAASGDFSTGFATAQTSTVWFAGTRFGSVDLRAARPDAPCPFREGPFPTGEDPIISLSGADDGAPFELYALSRGGALSRFDGSTWTRLATLVPQENMSKWGQVLWLAPGSAVAGYESHEIALVSSGTTTVDAVEVAIDSYGIQSLGMSARFGLLLGVYHVGTLARMRTGWEIIGEPRRANNVGFLIELDDHLFSGWPLGSIGQLVAGQETCSDLYSGFQRLPRVVAPLGAREILLAVEPTDSDTASYVTVMGAEDGCRP